MRRLWLILFLGFILGCLYILVNVGRAPSFLVFNKGKQPVSMKLTFLYTNCQHQEDVKQSLSKERQEQTIETLIEEGWEVIRLSVGEIELKREFPELCDGCKKEEFIGIYEDEIGVYAGNPQRPGPLKQVIPVKIERLPQEEIDDLKAGIICRETKEKLLIIEGYQN